MRLVLITVGLVVGLATPAVAAPNPSPQGPAHTGTACVAVLGSNPNAQPTGGHISDVGGGHFLAVGQTFCGLP
jgi:hypothetical protein